ncbi:diguanylate cyclase [Halomonas sp. NO4]|uniref:sensor domain-containing diguanylate cyclase n=1 Tax=Halomonas sp. NO4 TaxID=2484813 RepID=UPI0013D48BD9|nr:diguanylate cyclase [Halomonas sp. NO4]
MVRYPVPADETERLAVLHSLHLLESRDDPLFERMTRLATRCLDVPMAAVTLIGETEQRLAAEVGFGMCATPRSEAICAHTIAQSGPLVVEDLRRDPRFADHPAVDTEEGLRFYAGVSLRTTGGLAIGSLCIADRHPRRLTEAELTMLRDLAEVLCHDIHRREQLVDERRGRQRSERDREALAQRFRAVFDQSSMGMALLALDGGWVSVNPSLCRMLGYTEGELIGVTPPGITHPDDRDTERQRLAELMAGERATLHLELRWLTRHGKTLWVNLHLTSKLGPGGELEYVICIAENIQSRKAAEAALARLNQSLEAEVAERTQELTLVIENAFDAYVDTDADGHIRYWNRAAELLFGWQREEVWGQSLPELLFPEGEPRVDAVSELEARCRDGTRLPLEVHCRRWTLAGKVRLSLFIHDIRERRQLEALRERESRTDPLTQLPNRRALNERLPEAMARARRLGAPLALLFIDLDGFKAVNDAQGYAAGDSLLREIAARLREAVRETDSVGRLAGDEFVVVLEGIGAEDALAVARKLIAVIDRPLMLPRGEARVSASIGVAPYAPDGDLTPETLLQRADSAMYVAKRAGKGDVRLA